MLRVQHMVDEQWRPQDGAKHYESTMTLDVGQELSSLSKRH